MQRCPVLSIRPAVSSAGEGYSGGGISESEERKLRALLGKLSASLLAQTENAPTRAA